MPRTRISLAGVALVTAAIPACLGVPSPSPSPTAVARPQADMPPPPADVTVSRRQPPPLRHIDIRRVKVSPAPNPPPATQVVQAKAEQPAPPQTAEPPKAPPKLDLGPLDAIPEIQPPPAANTPRTADGESVALVALRHYQADAPDRAAEAMKPLDPWNRDVLKTLLPLAARLGSPEPQTPRPDELAATVEQLEAAAAALRAKAALKIARLCFCRPVQAPARFGVYEPLDCRPDAPSFRAGDVVAVYAELKNFACEHKDGAYRTRVASRVQVLDAGGRVAFRCDFDAADAARSPRQDYCLVGRFPLPKMPGGAYTLRLTVTDRPTDRTAEAAVAFRVAAGEAAGK